MPASSGKQKKQKTELNQKTARSSVAVVKHTHMTDQGEGRPPGLRRAGQEANAANGVAHPRQRKAVGKISARLACAGANVMLRREQ